jgi:UDP-4-amino-4,6-dideoxy-N-acetyl-beta-L-altrosamine N-acetyltransferase
MNRVGVESVEFASILEQPSDVIEYIREVRNSLGVRQYMYNDNLISREEHSTWVESLRGNESSRVMVVLFRGKTEGLVALHKINKTQKTADWAFYLSENVQGKGVGGVVEFKLIDMAFNEIGLEKLNCEVLMSNPKVIEMHQKFGFVLEGIRRANIVKESARMDVAMLGILREEWLEKRPRFARLFVNS